MLKLSTWLTILALVTLYTHSVVIEVENLPERCDFSKCITVDHNTSVLNVHLVPHTHDDVGWLKTKDQYYYGSHMWQQKAGVQYILDTVVEELIRNKDRRFIYVETAFFWMWWKEQDEHTRAITRELVRTGQLEFVNGGWSMPDEAVTHYQSLIDQTSWGFRRLNDSFGRCGAPRTTWQIDAFGHSREVASLFAQFNYDALYFARQDFADHRFRKARHTLEHVWQGSDQLGKASDLFTGCLDMVYGPPPDMNWNWDGQDDPVIDNPKSPEYNVPSIVDKFVSKARNYAKAFATNNILYPVGTDFNYMDAHKYFKNMDKLIKAVNAAGKGVKVFYSTPTCYTKALHESNHTFTGKDDDYLPLGDNPHLYWNGFYTSRPALKRMERVGNNWLQACKQLDVIALNGGKWDDKITQLREAMGVLQHHDAITGTEKEEVAKDYAKQLDSGIHACQEVIGESMVQIAHRLGQANPSHYTFCNYLNVSDCAISEVEGGFAVTIYNPVAHDLPKQTIRFPVNAGPLHFEVYDPQNRHVPATLMALDDHLRHVPGRKSPAKLDLVFHADLPAFGLVTYRILARHGNPIPDSATWAPKIKITGDTRIRSKSYDVMFDGTGHLREVQFHNNGPKIALRHTFRVYEDGSSNAYMFVPKKAPIDAARLTEAWWFHDEATGIHEVHQKFDRWLEQIVRIDTAHDYIELEYVAGPLPDDHNREIISVYETNLQTQKAFFTDANGRQLITRERDYRYSFPFKSEEPVASNYYPVVSKISIVDDRNGIQMTVLTDRPHGGSSVRQGQIELMIHRRLPADRDYLGPQKGLIVRGRHRVLLSHFHQAAVLHRPMAYQFHLEPILGFYKFSGDFLPPKSLTFYKGLNQPLPPQVQILTLEQWNYGRYLLRLEHIFTRNEDLDHESRPINVSLKNLFTAFEITAVEELTLGANLPISAAKNRLEFKYKPVGYEYQPPPMVPVDPVKLEVTMNPFHIRTFVIHTKPTGH